MTKVEEVCELLHKVWDGESATLTDDEKGIKLAIYYVGPDKENYEIFIHRIGAMSQMFYGLCFGLVTTFQIAAFVFATLIDKEEEQ